MTLSWISRVSCSSSSRPTVTAEAAGEAGLDDALRKHRLIDDEFADEIDQTVDPFELDADRRGRTARFRSLTASAAAPADPRAARPCDRRGAPAIGASGRSASAVDLGLNFLDQRGDIRFRLRSRRGHVGLVRRALDLKFAVAFDEFEDFADRRLVLGGREFDRPGEIGAVGLEFAEKGERRSRRRRPSYRRAAPSSRSSNVASLALA